MAYLNLLSPYFPCFLEDMCALGVWCALVMPLCGPTVSSAKDSAKKFVLGLTGYALPVFLTFLSGFDKFGTCRRCALESVEQL
jgi:hypothetical protein